MPMIASVLRLDQRAIREARIQDAYSIHRVVYNLFDDVRSEAEKTSSHPSGILYADYGKDSDGWRVLILSDRAPRTAVEYGHLESKPVPEGFLQHTRYRFKVIVNPTRRNRQSSKLMPVRKHEAIGHWFLERAPLSWGFEASEPHLQVDRVDVVRFASKALHPVTLAQAHIQGQLTVTDHERFHHSFRQGIGRGRAFGCGLLQIAPITETLF
jgi:CRISPR system Cascade subunit CasE